MNQSKRTYARPQGGNAFQQFAGSGREVHPLEVDYKKHKVGGRVRLRFLDLTPQAAYVFEARDVGILNRQNNSMMSIKVELPGEYDRHEDGSYDFVPASELKNMVDHGGTPILACKQVRIYRCPVWVYFEVDADGKQTDVDGLRFLEFTQGLRDSLDELVGFQNGVGAFNPETGRPDYDVDLCVVPGEGSISKNYKFEVVFLNAQTKRQHENFGVEAEDVLNEVMEEINENWEDVIEAMARQTTLEDFVKRLAPPKDNKGRGAGISARPGMGRAVTDEESREPLPQESAPPARPAGRKYGSR